MLCQDCSQITSDKNFLTEDFHQVLKASAADCAISAIGGCELCMFVMNLYGRTGKQSIEQFDAGALVIQHAKSQDASTCVLVFGPKRGIYHSVKFVDFCVTSDGKLALDRRISHRTVCEHAGASECLNRVSRLMSDCEQGHEECQLTSSTPFVPRRLLDLDSSSGICLRDEFGSGACRYVALSYCWGSPDPSKLVLLIENESQMKERIEESRLTTVFQEAVRLTRYFKVRYLWIDALCIVQDSRDDWATEASTMASVYRNATLTIGAAGSPDSNTSFLNSRRKSPGIWLPSPSAEDLGEQILLRPSYQVAHVVENHLKEPLQKRAWCFQERVLSRRTIYFDTEQFLFECHRGTFPESSAGQQDLTTWSIDDRSMLPYTKLDQVLRSGKQHRQVQSTEADERYHWYTLVEEYCQRKLTYPDDILPAFSGVARHFSALTGDTYLAGIWQQQIHMGLLWNFRSLQEPESFSRSKFAPTWSWASVWTPHGVLDSSAVKRYRIERMPSDRDAIFLRAELEPLHGDVTGQLRSGRLHISGLCREVQLTLEKKTKIREEHELGLLEPTFGLKASCWMDGDDDLEELLQRTAKQKWTLRMTALLLSQWDNTYRITQAMLRGLLLTTSKEDRYIRRGTFVIEAPELTHLTEENPMFKFGPRKLDFDGTWDGWERKTVIIE